MRVNNLPLSYYKRGMPNIFQANPRSRLLREEGEAFCGPASVANPLVWLAKNYFSTLLPPQGNQSEITAKLRLVEELASCMDSNGFGTSEEDLISGLRKYVRDRGFRAEVHWKGLDERDEYHCGGLTGVEWIMRSMLDDSNIILVVDNYKLKDKTGGSKWKKESGHYVSGAGFRTIKRHFHVHDPGKGEYKRTPETLYLQDVEDIQLRRSLLGSHGTGKAFYQLIEADSGFLSFGAKVILRGAIAFRVFRK